MYYQNCAHYLEDVLGSFSSFPILLLCLFVMSVVMIPIVLLFRMFGSALNNSSKNISGAVSVREKTASRVDQMALLYKKMQSGEISEAEYENERRRLFPKKT